jgi:O-antigen/teichoic acid export membrane protein
VGDLGLFYVLLTLIPLQLLANNFTAIVQGLSRFKAFSVFMLLNSGVFFLAVVIAICTAHNRLAGIVYAMVISGVFSAVALLIYLARTASGRSEFSLLFLKKGFHYGIRSHGSVVLETINRRLDQLVLGAMINPVELGWYSVAVSISELPQLLPDSIGTVLFPRVASDQANAVALTARACRVTVLAMLGVTAAMAVLSRPLISLVYGPAFSPAYKALMWLCPSIVSLGISKILTKYLCGMGKPQTVVWTTSISAAVTLALIFPLVKRYGMIGAAITSSAAYAVGAILNIIYTVRLSATRAADFLVPRKPDLHLHTAVR